MKICKFLVWFVCSLIIFSGCKEKDNVIAKVGKDTITTEFFSEKLMSAPPAYQAYINTDSGKKQFVDLLVKEKVILESAKQVAINKREEYKKTLNVFKQEQEKQLEDYKDRLMIEMWLKEVQDDIVSVKEDEINKYYEEHKKDFTDPIAVTAKHILVSSKKEAEIALDRIKKGENFKKVAQEMSTDKVSAQKGGQIGPFRRGELVKEFEDVAFNLKKGEMSNVVETAFGFHIITKVSEKKLQPIPEDMAKAEIKGIIQKTKFEKWFDDTKNKLNVVVDYSKLDQIKGAELADTIDAQQEKQN